MKQDNSKLADFLQSPINHEELILDQNSLTIKDSEFSYPNINDIPFLFKDPAASLQQWQGKTQLAFMQIESRIEENIANKTSTELSLMTKNRINEILKADQSNIEVLDKTISPLFDYSVDDLPILRSLASRFGFTQNIFSYENALMRDWGFEGEEDNINVEALNFITSLLPSNFKAGDMLVLGAGASRLPSDLSVFLKPNITIATDINPFLVLMSQRILSGEEIEYYEVPAVPTSINKAAVKRKLKLKGEAPENYKLLLSDALTYPFKKHSFDTLFTPWFIDIIHHDFSSFIKNINQSIKMGGYWVNFGPLYFDHREYGFKYTIEEVKAIAEKNGFEIEKCEEKEMAYLSSSSNSYKRIDKIYCIVAKKVKEVAPMFVSNNHLPEWILDIKKPVPMDQMVYLSKVRQIYTNLFTMLWMESDQFQI